MDRCVNIVWYVVSKYMNMIIVNCLGLCEGLDFEKSVILVYFNDNEFYSKF